jgi:hypothetical protein
MQAITQFNMQPDELAAKVAEMLLQASGIQGNAQGITPQELPELPAALAAHYLGCSVAHLATIEQRWPEYLRPIRGNGSTKYLTAQLLVVKQKGITYRKP